MKPENCNRDIVKRVCCRIMALVLIFCVLNPLLSDFSTIKVQAKTKSESVSTSVNKLFKGIQNTNVKTINTYVKSWKTKDDFDLSTINTYPNLAKYIKTNNQKMTYKIVSKKVKNNKATVKVKAKIVNSYSMADYVTKKLDKDAKEGLIYQKLMEQPENEREQFIVDYLDSCFKEASESIKVTKYKTCTVTLKMIKSGNKWKVVDGSDKLKNIVLADYIEAFEKASKNVNLEDYQ